MFIEKELVLESRDVDLMGSKIEKNIAKVVESLNEEERIRLANRALCILRVDMVEVLFDIKNYMKPCNQGDSSEKDLLKASQKHYFHMKKDLESYHVPLSQFEEVYHSLIAGNEVGDEVIGRLPFE